MHLLQGSVTADGTFAYVSQQAWIFHGTVQENVIMGEPLDQSKYIITLPTYLISKRTVLNIETKGLFKLNALTVSCHLLTLFLTLQIQQSLGCLRPQS